MKQSTLPRPGSVAQLHTREDLIEALAALVLQQLRRAALKRLQPATEVETPASDPQEGATDG